MVLDPFLLRFSYPSPFSNQFTFYYKKLLSVEWDTCLLYITSTIGITKKCMEILKMERSMHTNSLYDYVIFPRKREEEQVEKLMIHINR